ncbi:hypothetical protein RF55_2319 [Lasius niger]|uniref:Uncharacterized protein n=1 Tax=Lasius niger TaxID=67767 RepID=A0A0J7L3W7_LASNI|nr:hypothetical protein RF55_2319 [Lasius niger]
MVAAYNAALCLVASYRPDLFTDFEVIELVPGIYQDARCACSKVLDIVAQTDANGNVLRRIDGTKNTDQTAKRKWNKPSCLTSGGESDYYVSYANLLAGMNGQFEVNPSVPTAGSYYVMVKCAKKPCPLMEADLLSGSASLDGDCSDNVAAWHYVMARMLSGDRFSNGALERSQLEYRMFFQVLGVVERQDEKYEKETD